MILKVLNQKFVTKTVALVNVVKVMEARDVTNVWLDTMAIRHASHVTVLKLDPCPKFVTKVVVVPACQTSVDANVLPVKLAISIFPNVSGALVTHTVALVFHVTTRDSVNVPTTLMESGVMSAKKASTIIQVIMSNKQKL